MYLSKHSLFQIQLTFLMITFHFSQHEKLEESFSFQLDPNHHNLSGSNETEPDKIVKR